MSRKVQILESWEEIFGTLANPLRGIVYTLDLDKDVIEMAIYTTVATLLDRYHNDNVIFIEVYEEDN